MPLATHDAPLDTTKLQAAVVRLLRPLIHVLVRRGVTFPALCEILRELYVNVAEHEFTLPGKEQTDSRVSLLTGIHRKEVRRLRGAGAPITAVPASLSRTSRILARWLASAETTDAAGRPLPLPRVAPAGEPSFEALVAAVTRDVRPRSVLDEWIHNRLAVLSEDDVVSLVDTAIIPRADDERQLYYFGRNLHDHIAAAVGNVRGDEAPFLERAVHYDGLSAEAARTLEQRSRELAVEALLAANRHADAICDTDAGGRWRWNFGMYVYAEEVPVVDGSAAADPSGMESGSGSGRVREDRR